MSLVEAALVASPRPEVLAKPIQPLALSFVKTLDDTNADTADGIRPNTQSLSSLSNAAFVKSNDIW